MSYLSDELAVMAKINPQLVDNNTVVSDWVPLSHFKKVVFFLNVGATDTTVNAKLREATDGSGTGAADISGKAITALTGTDDNKQVVLEVDAAELTSTSAHVALSVTVGDGTTGAYVSAVGLGGNCRYLPANQYDLASVAQILAA